MADFGGYRTICRSHRDKRTRASRLLLLPKRLTADDGVRHGDGDRRHGGVYDTTAPRLAILDNKAGLPLHFSVGPSPLEV